LYTKEENPLRMATRHAGNTVSNVISGFLAAGILEHMDSIAGMHSWQSSIIFALPPFSFSPSGHPTRGP
jgi:hypothetical protein